MITRIERPLLKQEIHVLEMRARSIRRNIDSGVYPYDSLKKHMGKYATKLESDSVNGKGYVIHCEPSRIICRNEIDDEGTSWIFDGGDGSYLAIFGQDNPQTHRWPSSSFDIIFGSVHSTYIGIKSKGIPIQEMMFLRCEEECWENHPFRGDIFMFNGLPGISPSEIVEMCMNEDLEYNRLSG